MLTKIFFIFGYFTTPGVKVSFCLFRLLHILHVWSHMLNFGNKIFICHFINVNNNSNYGMTFLL